MNKLSQDRYHHHRDIWLLLPWYVNGSLNSDERLKVEKHAEICIACKRELVNQSVLLEKVRRPDSLDIASTASFTKLQQRMRRERSPGTLFTNALTRFGRVFADGTYRLSLPKTPLLAALSLLIISPLLFFGLLPVTEIDSTVQNHFRTLSSPRITPLGNNQIRLVLNGVVEQSSIVALMQPDYSISQSAGPDGVEIYTLTLKDAAEVPALIEKLKTHPDVVLAESSQSPESGVRP